MSRLSTAAAVLAIVSVALGGCPKSERRKSPEVEGARSLALTVEAEVTGIPADATELRLWIPVPRNEEVQVLRDMDAGGTTATRIVTDGELGNRAVLVVVPRPSPAESARVTFHVTREEQRGAVAGSGTGVEGETNRWLRDESLTFVDERIRKIAASIFTEEMSAEKKARTAYDYVFENMKYSKEGEGWGKGSVAWACDMKSGNCTDFHALFIALVRAGGVPARFRVGFPLPAERGEGAIAGYHCWAEWRSPSAGWVPVDISEAWKHPEKKDYLFGNLDSDRVGMSLGRDLVFEGQAGPPLNYFVFPYAEVDGKPRKVAARVTFRDRN